MTREIMGMFMLTQDHTMERVIKSMNDCNITESVIENLGTKEDKPPITTTTASTITPPTESIVNTSDNALRYISKKRKKNKKSIRLKKNRKAKEKALKVLKMHIAYLSTN